MRQLVSDVVLFAFSVMTTWQASAPATFLTGVIGVVEKVRDKTLSKRTYLAIFLGAYLLFGFFLVWRDEHRASLEARESVEETKQALQAEQEQNSPKLIGSIEQTVSGDLEDRPMLLLLISIRNTGTQSIAEGWWLTIKGKGIDITVPASQLRKGERISGKSVDFNPEDTIYEKAMHPIQRGDVLRGWLMYVVEGIELARLREPGTKLTVSFRDVRGSLYTATAELGEGKGDDRPRYIPGASNPFQLHPEKPPIKKSSH